MLLYKIDVMNTLQVEYKPINLKTYSYKEEITFW